MATCTDAELLDVDGGDFILAGCPAGSVCVEEIGGVAIAPAGRCVVVPAACAGASGCECVAACACPGETCLWGTSGELLCDNGVR